jgi:Fe(3+) dicitrate transport protein
VGYLNTLSATQEFEVKAYYNESFRQSALINAAKTQITWQPRNYQVTASSRATPSASRRRHDARRHRRLPLPARARRRQQLRQTVATGANGATTTFINSTDAHAAYIDDRIALGVAHHAGRALREHLVDAQRRVRQIDLRDRQQQGAAVAERGLPGEPRADRVRQLHHLVRRGAEHPAEFADASNPLKPELAKTAELGARWKGGVSRSDRLQDQVRQPDPAGAGHHPATFQNIGATNHDGIETAADYRLTKPARWPA